jgi:hypothetical protein
VLHVGEVPHVPRGYWHQATRAGLSNWFGLHATFGIVKRTGVDWGWREWPVGPVRTSGFATTYVGAVRTPGTPSRGRPGTGPGP